MTCVPESQVVTTGKSRNDYNYIIKFNRDDGSLMVPKRLIESRFRMEAMMKTKDEMHADDSVDLGDATSETRGGAPVGIYDSATQQYFLGAGIDQDD